MFRSLFVISGVILTIHYCQKNIASMRQNHLEAEAQQAADAKTLIIKRSQTQFIAKAVAGETVTALTAPILMKKFFSNLKIFSSQAKDDAWAVT